MNELTCNSICQLFCCPPVPSKIAAKLAFMPPPVSYRLSPVDDHGEEKVTFSYAEYLRDAFGQFVPDNIEVTTATTKRGNQIAALYMRNNPNSQLTFLLSHGNAVDLGMMVSFMYDLGTRLNVNMMCYDYSGYGASTGKPLEKNLYADAECAFQLLRTKFHIPLDKIVLYGQSIGTVPTVHLATIYQVAAVVLHSPLMSGLRVAFPRLKRTYCCDVFPNITRVPRMLSPTLIIHGLDDAIIHPMHAARLYELIPNALEPLFIHGAGHNDCEMFEEYLTRLEYFVHVEVLCGSPYPPASRQTRQGTVQRASMSSRRRPISTPGGKRRTRVIPVKETPGHANNAVAVSPNDSSANGKPNCKSNHKADTSSWRRAITPNWLTRRTDPEGTTRLANAGLSPVSLSPSSHSETISVESDMHQSNLPVRVNTRERQAGSPRCASAKRSGSTVTSTGECRSCP